MVTHGPDVLILLQIHSIQKGHQSTALRKNKFIRQLTKNFISNLQYYSKNSLELTNFDSGLTMSSASGLLLLVGVKKGALQASIRC
jgi:hypothetical protein